jgi:hypothetical protein
MIDLESPLELARRTGWPVRRIRILISQKHLRHIRIGTNIFVPVGALEEFVDASMVEPELGKAAEVGT